MKNLFKSDKLVVVGSGKKSSIAVDNPTIKDRLDAWLSHLILSCPDTNCPREWLQDQDECVDRVSSLPVRYCVYWLKVVDDGLAHVPLYDHPCRTPYNAVTLINIADREDWDALERLAYLSGSPMLWYGYRALQALFAWRYWWYVFSNGTVDQLYVRYSDIILEDPRNKPDIEESQKRLFKYIQNNYCAEIRKAVVSKTDKMETEINIDIPEENRKDIASALSEVLMNDRLPQEITDFMVAAGEGEDNIAYIPYSTALKLIDLHKRQKDDAMSKMWIGGIPIKNDDSQEMISVEQVVNLLKDPNDHFQEMIFVEQVVDLLKDPLDRKIAKLMCEDCKEREIAQKLSISRRTVTNRKNKIKQSLRAKCDLERF